MWLEGRKCMIMKLVDEILTHGIWRFNVTLLGHDVTL
jgi:hypothetical protein